MSTLNNYIGNYKIKKQIILAIASALKRKEPIKHMLFSGPPGLGKAQPLDANILTPNGYVKMGDLKQGCIVSTPDGLSAQVIGIYPQGISDVYRVTFSDNTSTECTLGHLWFTKTLNDRINKRPGSVKSLEQIINSLTVTKKLNHSIPSVAPIEFKQSEKSTIDPYFLGLLLGDGCLQKNSVGLSSKDKEIVTYVTNYCANNNSKLVKQNGCDYRIRKSYKNDVNKTGVHSEKNKILKQLIELGLNGKHSWEKFVPERYKITSSKNRLELLRGLMDTDGTVHRSGNPVTFSTSSKQLATDVVFLVESLGGRATINVKKQPKYKYKGKINIGREAYVVVISFSNEIVPFKLSRKVKLFKKRSKYIETRYIKLIEYVGKKECQCIYVNSNDHLYITNNFIVTHNTSMSKVISDITKIPLFTLNPEGLKSSEDLMLFAKKIASKKSLQNLIFIDEIHELSLKAQEILGIAMEEGKMFVDNGYLSKEIKLPNFTILGATTVPGILSKPFLDRFGAILLFDFYSIEECSSIAKNYLARKVPYASLQKEALDGIAKRGRGTPRIIEKLCDRVIDFITVNSITNITPDVIKEVMDIAEIDSEGLTKSDVTIMKQLFTAGRPIGIDNLAACSGEDIKTISTKIEPFLIRQGFLVRTPQGRMLTPVGVDYLINNDYVTSSF